MSSRHEVPRPASRGGLLRLALAGATVLAAGCGSERVAGAVPPTEPSGPWAGFATAVVTTLDDELTGPLAVGDLTGDGRADVVALSTSGVAGPRAVLLRALDAGRFAPLGALPAGGTPRRAAVADMDRDGRQDLLVIGHFDNGFRVWRARDGGGFAAPTFHALPNHGRHLAVADHDGDGLPDVLAVHDGSGGAIGVQFFRNAAAGALEARWSQQTGDVAARALCDADLDGDGRRDLAIATGDPARPVLVARGLGGGTFAQPSLLPPLGDGGAEEAMALACADVAPGGGAELRVARDGEPSRITVHAITAGQPRLVQRIPLPGVEALASADVDADGRADVVALQLGRSVSLLRGRPEGGLEAPVALHVTAGGATPLRGVQLADVTGDRRPDIVLSTPSAIVVLPNAGRTGG